MPHPGFAVVTGAFSYTGGYVTGVCSTRASASGR